MKTTLTIEQSAKLIELCVPKKRASIAAPVPASYSTDEENELARVFDMGDLLSMFQKTIEAKNLRFGIEWDDYQKSWIVYCSWHDKYIKYSDYEMADALYEMLVHLIENNYVKPQEL